MCNKVFKTESSEICRRQPLKNITIYRHIIQIF